ncbi:hypothetical protein EKO27_g254 [Xylaria grammica]|uniref:Uncharacterized protein n=1 Tax=Xylaria grammica TaxID=363999 RepID=A0A439DKA6_9PEZI|nr:hypothetical protein EKO27_g254 [Xylaria grammica]
MAGVRASLETRNIELEGRNAALQDTVTELLEEQRQLKVRLGDIEGENRELKVAREGYMQQIFKLRPFEPDQKPYDLEVDFRDFSYHLDNWAFKWTARFFDSGEEYVNRWLSDMSSSKQVFPQFQQSLQSVPDLYQAVGYPDADSEIFTAWLLRFIWGRVFGDFTMKPTGVLTAIEALMPQCKEPRLDMSTILDWRGQAYHAVFTDPEYPQLRQRAIDVFSAALAETLAFIPEPSQKAAFTRSIPTLFERCFDIYEKCQRSNADYYIDVTYPTRQNVPDVVGRLFRKDVRCQSTRARAILTVDKLVDKLERQLTPVEVEQQLHIIFSIKPAFKMRSWKLYNGREQILQQEILCIAWDPDLVERGNPAQLKEETWLSRVCAL